MPKLRGINASAPADSANRDRAARQIDESLMVEASAGTGKTTLLVTRIVNLLIRGQVNGRPLRMDEIVAITFTEKAAGELKARLRSVLEQAASNGKFDGVTLTQGDRSQLRRAIHDLDTAAVTTIHSFCASLLRERPVEAGIDPLRTVADPLAQQLLIDEAWMRWCERAMQSHDDEALLEPLRLEIKPERTGPNDRSASLRDLAETLVENRDLLDYLPTPIDEDREWARMVERIKLRCEELETCLADAIDEDKAVRLARSFIEQARELASQSPAQARPAVWRLSIEKNTGGSSKKWRHEESLARLQELLADTRGLIIEAQETLGHNLIAALAARLVEFVQSYEALKAERGLLDFQDLLLIARDMLVNSQDASRHFWEKFRFLLVDEFQDTDPLQAEIVLILSTRDGTLDGEVDPGRLFIVGDPKQSIYRFRRADIEVYEQCRRRLGSEHHLTIRQNFRSGSEVIETVNRLFENLIQRSIDGAYQPDYVPLLPGPRAAESPGRVVLLCPPDPERDRSGAIGEIRFREGCAIARFIQQAVNERWPISGDSGKLELSDVAILFTQFTDIDRYEDSFRACGLEYHIAGGRHFYERIEIKSLLAVVAAIDNPEAEISVVAALRSPFIGACDEDLLRHALAGGRFNYLAPGVPSSSLPPTIADSFALFRSLHQQRNDRSVAQTLLAFFDETKGLESFLIKPQGEQRVANLLKVVDSVQAQERSSVLTWRGFVR